MLSIVSAGLVMAAIVSGIVIPRSEFYPGTRNMIERGNHNQLPSGDPICLDGAVGNGRYVYRAVNDGISAIRSRIAKDGVLFSITPIKKNGGKCVRMTCSYDLAIYACNDADTNAVTTFDTLAKYVERIRDTCGADTNNAWVHGQQFASDVDGNRWNVIIDSERC